MAMNQNAYQIAGQMQDYMQRQSANTNSARTAIQQPVNQYQPAQQQSQINPLMLSYINNLASGFDAYAQQQQYSNPRVQQLYEQLAGTKLGPMFPSTDEQKFGAYMNSRINSAGGGK